ncbi:MAG TPA: 2-C-methyl-D-erythritol 4-phosphate cytidylyltransferase [Lacisediminihabitans sp.]|uniref:2-C-methyl-D-erythritol 4-phosphate cytidylyltransferase n=1 Tax=Lacisediminihabitans sp. TaxID=2787631 RepID=UPI002EDBA580
MLPSGGIDAACAVVVVAAGSGSRLGAPLPKAFVEIAGRTILAHALETVFAMAEPVQLIVVAPADSLEAARGLTLSVAGVASGYTTVVAGAETRQGSVAAGLAALLPSIETVLVHDAARAFTPASLFDAVVAAVAATGAGVIPGLPVTDTIKRTDAGRALETIDRSELVAVQTPQGFPRRQLVEAYAMAAEDYTDDAALFAAAGHPVTVIEGDSLAFKITTPWDLRRAESLISPEAVQTRTGVGIDVHAYDDGSPLWLGGLYWPDEPGLAGHSDGDALSHAICDALLSAAGLGDIGGRFGTAEERFAGAHGEVFLTETVRLVTGAGYSVGNVAVQVVARHPKLAARRTEIEGYLGGLIGAPVSIAATTSDGLGFTGRGEGIAVISTALLYRTR